MTDDTDRPPPGASGDGGDGPPADPVRRRPGGPSTDEIRWGPEPAADAPTQAFSWNLAGNDDTDRGDDASGDGARRDGAAAGDEATRAAGLRNPSATSASQPAPLDASRDASLGASADRGQPPTEAIAWDQAAGPQGGPGAPLPHGARQTGGGTGPIGIDALFQPGQFRDFEPTTVLPPREPKVTGATAISPRTRPSLTSAQRSLLWAAGVLVAILVLLALFAIGRRLPAMFAAPPAPVATVTAAPTPTPEPVDPAAGPLPPGEYEWDELRGGECLEPFESAWQEDYTVIDCGAPHAAQLLVRAPFPEDAAPGGGYPGFDELAGRLNLLCTDPTVIDYGAAGGFDDIVVEGAHAVTPEEWEAGHREYFCFLTRSSGEPFSGSLVPRGQ